jgi:HD-like signal output (HDOD) protein
MSHNVQELISLTCSSRSAASELSRVILKDYSLTNKVLQVVNSAYYSIGRPVNSISRAVAILGFDAVRDLATAIALFEEFVKSGVEKDSISMLLTRSFLSGLQARDMAVEKNLNLPPEEAFICTLLHNLGKIIICIYLPEKYREIEQKISNGMSEEGAARAVLSELTYNDVGQEVAKFWNLSEKAIASMTNSPPKPANTYDTDAYLQNLAYFSNSFVDNICDGSDLTPTMDRYGELFSVDAAEVVERVLNCVEVSEDVSDSIRYGLNKLKIRSRLSNAQRNVESGILSSAKPKPEGKDAANKAAEARRLAADHERNLDGLNELPISTDKSIDDFIRDITETLMGPFDLNDFYANLLEGLYRGIGFDRVILAIVSVQPTKVSLVGRFGLGEIDPAGVKKFEHDLAKGTYAIPSALKACKDMLIPANKQNAFPDDLQYLVKDRNVYLFPVCLDGKGIGMIYLDRKAGRPNLDKSRVKTVRLFRDFAVMAIRKIRKNN